jgi:photosystem II stability/assembly factor-like uncharacterized protein
MIHGSLPAPTTHHNVRDLSVDPRNADRLVVLLGDLWTQAGIFLSIDGGRRWKKSLAASFTGNGPFRAAGSLLARHPALPDVLMAVSEGTGGWRSNDHGVTWQEMPGLRDLMPTHLYFDPNNPKQLWLCASTYQGVIQGRKLNAKAGFYRSKDGGATWRQLSEQGPSEVLRAPKDRHLLYGLWGDYGVCISRDEGQTWTPWNDGLPVQPEKIKEPLGWFFNFTSFAAGPDFVLATTAKGWIYRQNDGSKIWSRVDPVSFVNKYYGEIWHAALRDPMGQEGRGSATSAIMVDPRNPSRWFITDWFALYQTYDSGKNWNLSINGIEPTYIHGFQQDPVDPERIHLFMEDNGAFWSRDGGRRFHLGSGITKDVKRVAVSPQAPHTMVAVGVDLSGAGAKSNQVYISHDRGLNWKPSPMNGLEALRTHHGCSVIADPRSAAGFYITVAGPVGPGLGGVYRSDDHGLSWIWMGQGLNYQNKPYFYDDIWHIGRELGVDASGRLVAFSHRQKLIHQWNPQKMIWELCRTDFKGSPNDICPDPSRAGYFYLAVEGEGVFQTENAGKNWKILLIKSVRHLAIDLYRPERIAVGTPDGVVLSENAGQSWRTLDRSLPSRDLNCVGFVGNHLLAGSNGSGAFWINLSKMP